MDFNFTGTPPLSLYIHLPWCVRKCPYCDFNSHVVNKSIPEHEYIEALLKDLSNEFSRVQDRRVETVFFGGGTPSLFSPEAIDRLFTGLRRSFELAADVEVTLEVNPGTIDQGILEEYKQIGINRLSLGVQSFNDHLLKRLGRIHTADEARRAIELSTKVGFDNLNIDLMYALPGQTKGMCTEDLRAAVQYDPSHISYYQLTIEPHTAFYSCPPRLPSEESQWDMQELGKQVFCNHDYTQYEVSAFSRPGKRCKHNLNYWTFGDYLGIGAGAHGKWTETRNHRIYRNSKTRQPMHYMKSVQQGIEKRRLLTTGDVIFEFMLNALRLSAGFSLNLFKEHTGLPIDKITSPINEAIERGLLTIDDAHLSTTELGKRFHNDLVMLFMPRYNIQEPLD